MGGGCSGFQYSLTVDSAYDEENDNLYEQHEVQVIVDKKKSKKLDHGKRLVADVKQEFVIETDFTKNSGWGNFLGTCVKAWIKRDMEKEITKFQIKNYILKR